MVEVGLQNRRLLDFFPAPLPSVTLWLTVRLFFVQVRPSTNQIVFEGDPLKLTCRVGGAGVGPAASVRILWLHQAAAGAGAQVTTNPFANRIHSSHSRRLKMRQRMFTPYLILELPSSNPTRSVTVHFSLLGSIKFQLNPFQLQQTTISQLESSASFLIRLENIPPKRVLELDHHLM